MKKKQIRGLLDKAISAYYHHDYARETFWAWRREHPEPEYKGAYELIDDFLQFEHERQAYKAKRTELVNRLDQEVYCLAAVRDEFHSKLPAKVWFRVETIGIGLAFKYGQGYFIQIEPWSDKMPKLEQV